jgi:hypothetical protein
VLIDWNDAKHDVMQIAKALEEEGDAYVQPHVDARVTTPIKYCVARNSKPPLAVGCQVRPDDTTPVCVNALMIAVAEPYPQLSSHASTHATPEAATGAKVNKNLQVGRGH